GHGGIFLITPGYIILGLFPFSAFIIQAVAKGWKERENDFLFFNWIAALSIVLFFTVSKTKLPNYTVPAYPFFATLLGYYLVSLFTGNKNEKKKGFKASSWFLLIFSILVPVGAYIAFSLDESLLPVRNVAFLLLILPIGILWAFFKFQKSEYRQAAKITAATTILTSLVVFCIAMPIVDRQNPVIKCVEQVKNSSPIVFWEKYNPAFSFYLKRPIRELKDSVDFRNFVANNPNGVIITTTKKIKDIDPKLVLKTDTVSKGKDLFETPVTLVLRPKRINLQ
ncbi:MAG: hypothetical protein Q8859_07135, partial [Bacteroidota bacterium]|nr:hypothetical protein [Bacteroidota bacterium]